MIKATFKGNLKDNYASYEDFLKGNKHKCLCGKDATHIADLPIRNVFLASGRQAYGEQRVCNYHAQKAQALGYFTEQVVL